MSSIVSPSTRLLQQLRIAAADSVLYFHPESSAQVAIGARAATEGRVVVSHRRWPAVTQMQRDLTMGGLTQVPVYHAHGLATWSSRGGAHEHAFDLVVIRLPSERVAFYQLVLDAVQVLKPRGRCVVVGGNGEGIRPAAKVLEGVFGQCAVMGHAGGHRVLMSVRGERVDLSALQPLVAPFDDVIITGTGVGLGFGGHVLVEVGRGRAISQDNDLTSGKVYGIQAVRGGALDVAGGVLEFGGLAEVRDFAVVHIDERPVSDEDGLGVFRFDG